MQILKSIFIAIFLLISLKSFADPTPPKVPDPFCSPSDFFAYLNKWNHDRVLYIVQKCSNIDLNEKGPKGETFVETLAMAGWEDVFTIVKDNKEVNFQPALLKLISSKRYVWLEKLLERESLKFGSNELAAIGYTFPDSKNFLTKLVDQGRVNLNIVTEENLSFLLAAVRQQRYDLVEFLRSIPSVDQSQLFSYTCSLLNNADPKVTFRQYFYLLVKEGGFDVNTTCANGSSLAANVLQSGIDSKVVDEVFFNSNLDFSKPSASYKIAEVLARNAKVAEKYFDVVFKNPTFNYKDKTSELRTMWHLVAAYFTTHDSTKFITYFENANRDSINDVDKNGNTPLTLLIAALGDRRFDASNPTVKEFFKNNDLDVNKLQQNRTPLTLAFYYNAFDFAEFLISKGASVTNVGSIKVNEAELLKAMIAREKFWDLFFKLPELDINKSFKADSRSEYGTLFSYIMKSGAPARMSKNISQLIKDTRFKKEDVDAFYDRNYCSSTTAWLKANPSDRKTLFELAALSTDAGLNKACSSSANYHSAMSYAALIGDLEFVTYLYGTRKLPENVSNGQSAFLVSYSNKQWPIVEYFISKGYKVSPNETSYIEALLRDGKYDLLKKQLIDPEFNPNIGLGYYNSDNLLKLLANEKGKDAFMLLLNNPKLTIGDKLESLVNTYEEGKPATFLDAALDKFTIKTAEDKLRAVLVSEKFLENRLPVSYFEKISKYKNFDVNLVIPKDNLFQFFALIRIRLEAGKLIASLRFFPIRNSLLVVSINTKLIIKSSFEIFNPL
jgi:ankyrin repeat protein